jgi:hypothetical protein
MMTDVLPQVESHLKIWELGDAAQRAAEIDRIYTPDVEITEPDGVIHGRAELNSRIGQLQDHFGGMSFMISGPVMSHNGYAFYPWDQQDRHGQHIAHGWDVLHFDSDHIDRAVMFIADFDSLQVPGHG